MLGKTSTDAEAEAVAVGDVPFDRPGAKGRDTARFAPWTVEARSESQLVMCDYQGRTRLWFMVEALSEGGPSTSSGQADVRGASVRQSSGQADVRGASVRLSSGQNVIGTRVYFGTAIAAARGGHIPFAFRAMMPLHRLYSRALLWSAVRGLRAG